MPALVCKKSLKNLTPPSLWYSAYSDWVRRSVMARPSSVFSLTIIQPRIATKTKQSSTVCRSPQQRQTRRSERRSGLFAWLGLTWWCPTKAPPSGLHIGWLGIFKLFGVGTWERHFCALWGTPVVPHLPAASSSISASLRRSWMHFIS